MICFNIIHKDVDRTGLTISRTNDASTFQSKDASQPILEGLEY